MSPHTVNCPLQGRVTLFVSHWHRTTQSLPWKQICLISCFWEQVLLSCQGWPPISHPPASPSWDYRCTIHPVRKLVLETSQECYYSSPTKEKKRRNRKPRISSLLSLTPFPSSRIFLLLQNRFLGTSHHYLVFLSSLRQTEVAKQSLGTWGRLIMSCFQTVKRVGQTVSCALC